MLIIFGTKTEQKNLGIKKEMTECARCGQPVFLNNIKQSNYFTLFWIPIFPYKEEYLEVCPTCGYTIKKAKEDIDKMNKN